jgi:hypothetical protein
VTSSPPSASRVLALANEELEEAARGYLRSRQLQTLTLSAGIAVVFTSSGYLMYALALLALISQASAWGMRYFARARQANGEEGRMRGLLYDGLGSTDEHLDLANLENRISRGAHDRASASTDPEYFASKAPSGLVRLREHLRENAFWNKCLYGAAVKRHGTLLAAFVAAILIAAATAVPLAPSGWSLKGATVLVTALTLGAGVTQLNEILAWRGAESRMDAVGRRLEVVAKCSEAELRSQKLDSILAIFADYSVATASTPPIPKAIYLRERDRLNALWRQMKTDPLPEVRSNDARESTTDTSPRSHG